MVKTDVLPVPPEMIHHVWKSVHIALANIPDYNIERTHMRLLAGIDQLWMAWTPPGGRPDRTTLGVIITSISPRPPQNRKAYQRADKALMKSLTIHLAGVIGIHTWIDSAIERIGRYAREHGCHMIFILARKGWHRFITRRFWSPEWELMALGRDRPTVSTCKRFRFRNRPGYFRQMVPVPPEKWKRWMTSFMGTCYFEEKAPYEPAA